MCVIYAQVAQECFSLIQILLQIEPLTEVQLSRLLDDVNLKPSDKGNLTFALTFADQIVSPTIDLADFLQGPTKAVSNSPCPEAGMSRSQDDR